MINLPKDTAQENTSLTLALCSLTVCVFNTKWWRAQWGEYLGKGWKRVGRGQTGGILEKEGSKPVEAQLHQIQHLHEGLFTLTQKVLFLTNSKAFAEMSRILIGEYSTCRGRGQTSFSPEDSGLLQQPASPQDARQPFKHHRQLRIGLPIREDQINLLWTKAIHGCIQFYIRSGTIITYPLFLVFSPAHVNAYLLIQSPPKNNRRPRNVIRKSLGSSAIRKQDSSVLNSAFRIRQNGSQSK